MRFSMRLKHLHTTQPTLSRQPPTATALSGASGGWKMLEVLMRGRYRQRDLGKEMSTPARVVSKWAVAYDGPQIQDQPWLIMTDHSDFHDFSWFFYSSLRFSVLRAKQCWPRPRGDTHCRFSAVPAIENDWADHKPPHLTFDTFWPIFKASWSHAFWESVASICWIGRSWASHPLYPPSRISTRCLDGQLFRKKLATLLLWFSPAESVAFEGLW